MTYRRPMPTFQVEMPWRCNKCRAEVRGRFKSGARTVLKP